MWLSLQPTNVRAFTKSKNDERYIVMDTIPDTDYLLQINENTFCSDETYEKKRYLGLGEKIGKGYLILRNMKDLDKSFVSYEGIGDYRTGLFYYYPERNSIETIIYLNENTFEMVERKLENLNRIDTISIQLTEREILDNGEENWLHTEYQMMKWKVSDREYGLLNIGECIFGFSNVNKEINNQITELNKSFIENKIETNNLITNIKNEIDSIKDIQISKHKTIKIIPYLIFILILIAIFK